MIANLRETTQANPEQDWLKTNLARISGLMQGQRDLATVARLIMSELTPMVTAQYGAFFLAEPRTADGTALRAGRHATATRGASDLPERFALGEGLVGQAALEGRRSSSTTCRPLRPDHLGPRRGARRRT